MNREAANLKESINKTTTTSPPSGATNSPSTPKNRDELLQLLARISQDDFESNCRRYEAHIHAYIVTLDDIIACNARLSPEKFQIILAHIHTSCFEPSPNQGMDPNSLKFFLEASFVPIHCKKLILLNEYRFISSVDKFSKTLEEIKNAAITEEEKQSLLLSFLSQGLKEYYRFASGRWFFYTIMATLSQFSFPREGQEATILENFIAHCVSEYAKSGNNKIFNEIIWEITALGQENQKLWIKFIAPIINEHFGFCTNNSEFRSTIASLNKLLPALEEKESLLITLIRNGIYNHGGFCKNINDCCLILESISNTGLSSKAKETLIIALFTKTTNEHYAFFKTDYDYFCMILALTKLTFLEEDKQRILKKFIAVFYNKYKQKKDYYYFIGNMLGLSKYFLEDGEKTFLISFIELFNEEIIWGHRGDFYKILQAISKIFRIDEINNTDAIKRLVISWTQLCCGYPKDFKYLINEVNELNLHVEFKRIVLMNYLGHLSKVCENNADFVAIFNSICSSSLLTNEDKYTLLMHFIELDIKKYVGLCQNFSEFSNRIDGINSLFSLIAKTDAVIEKKQEILFNFYSAVIQNHFGFCNKNESIFYNLLEKVCSAPLSNHDRQCLLKNLIDQSPAQIKGLNREALIKWVEQQPNLEALFKHSLISSLETSIKNNPSPVVVEEVSSPTKKTTEKDASVLPKVSKMSRLLGWFSCATHSKNKIDNQHAALDNSFSKK